MSEKIARLAVNYLRDFMFPALPIDIQNLFPLVNDPFASPDSTDPVPNIVVGEYQDFGANASLPMITAYAEGAAEGIVPHYRHLTLHIDIWVGANQSPNVDSRRVISILYEYVFRTLDNTNWTPTKQGVQIERSYEIERSAILFEPTNRIYHISNSYRVEALSASGWY